MPSSAPDRLLRAALLALAVVVTVGCGSTRAPAPAPKPVPAPSGGITLNGQCSQREDDGFREQATVRVSGGQVQALDWKLWVGNKGGCSFNLAQFRQTKTRPSIELQPIDGGACKLMMWSDPRRITLAHANCERYCTGNVYDRAWPVMFDPKTGACAKNER